MEAESPRKLNKYVHEVSDFELINLGNNIFSVFHFVVFRYFAYHYHYYYYYYYK